MCFNDWTEAEAWVLPRYGFESSPSHISAIVIGVHPSSRETFVDMADMDDDAFERMERQREIEDRRQQAEERERRQLEAIQSAQGDGPQLPPGPGDAYSPVCESD